ncbi:MAG: ADP-ribosylglycohydrolase family protein [Lachnospiraceae bacterium]
MELMKLGYEEYYDKVYGGWLGKCLGGAAGAPVEGIKQLITTKHYRELFRSDLPNDDLDLQLLWLEVMQKKGFAITAEDLAYAWNKQCWYPFSEYGIFLKNYERGIMPPYSGWFNNPLFCEGEGSPIRSEIWAMVFPGRPALAAEYAKLDSSLDHSGASVWIEQYYAAIEAAAFYESDILKLLNTYLCYLPKDSRPYLCVQETISYYHGGNRDWVKARTHMLQRFGHHEFTNAVTNLGLVVIALLYGQNDMDCIINIAFRSGYDADCTCATAGALFGIIVGASGIEESLKRMVQDTFVVGIDLENKNDSIQTLTQETCALGIKALQEVDSSILKPKIETEVTIEVKYLQRPAIGLDDTCEIMIKLTNHTDHIIKGTLKLQKLPTGWNAAKNDIYVELQAGEMQNIENCITTGKEVSFLNNTNILEITYDSYRKEFGIAGASIWKAIGPFFQQLDKKDREGLPSPHGENCILPSLECMVNNMVFIDKPYIDETKLQAEIQREESQIINAYEDLIPCDDVFTYRGQGCVYLSQTIESPADREAWIVLGNNDGFRIWVNDQLVMERDEIRLWTPYNNYEIIPLKKGKNEIVLKLLKRTEHLQFSFGIRKYEGEHFHRKRWYVDFKSYR